MKFTVTLPPLRITKKIADRFDQELKLTGLNSSELRRKILINYFKEKDIDKEKIEIERGGKNLRYEIRINENLYKNLERLNYLDIHNSLSSLVKNLLLSEINKTKLLKEEDKNKLEESVFEIQAIGRNLNQITRALNYQVKATGEIKNEKIEELFNVISELKTDLKKVKKTVFNVLQE